MNNHQCPTTSQQRSESNRAASPIYTHILIRDRSHIGRLSKLPRLGLDLLRSLASPPRKSSPAITKRNGHAQDRFLAESGCPRRISLCFSPSCSPARRLSSSHIGITSAVQVNPSGHSYTGRFPVWRPAGLLELDACGQAPVRPVQREARQM